jgi:hypothetical protein
MNYTTNTNINTEDEIFPTPSKNGLINNTPNNTHTTTNESIEKNEKNVSTKQPPSNESYQNNNDIFTTIQSTTKEIFTLQNTLSFIWFLAIYFVLFYLIKFFYKNDMNPLNQQLALSRTIDLFLFGLLIVILIVSYYSLSEDDKQHLIGYCLLYTKTFFENPNTFFSTVLFIVMFYSFVYFCGVPMTQETMPISIKIIEQKLWILLLMIIFIDFFKYIFDISIMDLIYGKDNQLISMWYNLKQRVENKTETDSSNVDISNNTDISSNTATPTTTHPQKKEEVFNISNNLYTYDDAQNVCKSFNSRLATVDELNEAYEDGAEWCVNSWSADMQVLFPTQQATYDKLQKIKGAENNCGRTGVNGGRIKNKHLRFGVNCYGIKPDPSQDELNRMKQMNEHIFPKSKEDMIMDAKVNFWKKNKDKYIVINPFNGKKWNEE